MKISRLLIPGALALAAIAVASCANHNIPSTVAPPTASTSTPAATVAVNSSSVQVSLAPYFNVQGIYPDGAQFSNGVDRSGFACSSNLLGVVQICNGVPFQLGSAINGSNVIVCQGQTIALPPGNFSKLQMLAIAIHGAQADQPFSVTYADNSSQTNTQTLSDWGQPDSNTGESQAVAMNYRNQSDGSKDENPYYLYGYSFGLNPAKGVQSLKLPDNNDVEVFALTLVP